MNLSNMIKKLRKENNMTQFQLAEATHIPYSTLRSYESGTREPSIQNFTALQKFFDVTAEYLRGENEESKWQNNEIKEAIEDNLSIAAESLINTTRKGTDQSMSMIFDILVELRHIMKLDQDKQSEIYSSLLQGILTETTIFMDVCNSSSIEQFSDRCNRSKEDVVTRFTEHLNTFQTELLEQKKNSKNN